ncbi:GSCOCG00008235001-RA-CDS [Cotesia congregata]|nr:GSCOCG00008235001-RA-CDS [Cotesia congregata]
MSIEITRQAKVLSNDNDQVRLAVKRRLSYPDNNVTIKRQKKFEHEIDCNRQMNRSNDAEVLSIIITLNEQFPIAWTFVPGINQLIAIQLDRVKLNERIRLIINDDQSVLVTYSEHYKKKIDVQIKSVNDLINFIKSMELKTLCTGTGYDLKNFSLKCHGDVSDIYKRSQATPRCPECRKLRVRLLKLKKGQNLNIADKVEVTSKAINLGLVKKTKRIKKQLQSCSSKLRDIQRKTKTIYKGEFNKKLSLLPKQQQITVRMCFENVNKKGPTGKRYEVEWIYECLLIRMKSTCTYNMIRARNIIPWPTIDTLSKYIGKISSSIFGFLPETFEVLRKKASSMAPEEKIGQISADEVKLMENIEYNKKIAEYSGFVDLGKYTTESDKDVAGDHALVFMFVPYRGSSAQPLGCFITKNSITSEVLHKLFLECIILVENAGFHVNLIVTDAAQWNRGVWTKLGVGPNNNSCEHPCDSSCRLWVISDFPHLVKCFRNGLVELEEFETPVGLVKKKYWQNLLLVEQFEKPNLAMAYKLTPAHLDPKLYQKMSVPLAYQLYSREVRCAMTVLRENGNEKFEGSEPTEKFIKIIDDGIQAMTSHDAKNALYFKDTCEQQQIYSS